MNYGWFCFCIFVQNPRCIRFFFGSFFVHFWMKSSYFWAVRNFDQFHEDNRKNPHDHIMTFFTEFLQREPFYTYSGAFTPKVLIFFLKKKKEPILCNTRNLIDLWVILLLKIWMNLEKLVQRCPTGSWRWRTTKNDSFTTVHAKSRRPLIISKANRTGKTCCIVTGERSKCKAYSSWFKKNAWCQVRLRIKVHRGNLLHCFHWEAKNGEANSRVLFWNTLTRQIWENLLLKAIKSFCSVKQDLNLWDRNIKLDLSIIASVSFSSKLMLKDWNYRTLNTDAMSLDENKFVFYKNYLWRKKHFEILRSKVCAKCKKWSELKNYELMKSHCKN